MTTIYAVVYEGSNEQPKAFIQQRPAMALFNREAKRLRLGDVTWESVKCKQLQFEGTPRAVACTALATGSEIGDGSEIRHACGFADETILAEECAS